MLASLFFVEQKQGWSGIMPKMPTQYQIREPLRRSIEFYLKLDIMERARRRSELQQRLSVLRAEYASLRGALDAAAQVSNARVVGTSEFGTPTFYRYPLFGADSDGVAAGSVVTVFNRDRWESLEDTLDHLQSEIQEAGTLRRPQLTESESFTLSSALREARSRLRGITMELQSLDDSANMMDMQRGVLEKRRRLLEQELRRYKDISALESMGAQFSARAIAHHDCPTCQQSLNGTESLSGAPVLSTIESAALVAQQLETVSNVIGDASASARANESARSSLEQESGEIRARIRALQADLEAEAPNVSIERLQSKLIAEARFRELVRLRDSAQVVVNDLLAAQTSAILLKSELDSLGDDEFSPTDDSKLTRWQNEIQEFLGAFGFLVFAPREITIDPQTMRPAHGDSDLGFQGSASDGLKLRWAYLLSLVQTSAAVGGCHPGLLLLDGPRMYDVEPAAMRSFLRSCSQLRGEGGRAQVILTLSEDPAVIREWLSNCAYSIVDIPDRLLV
ncbi:hypothetical protein [Streptomyces sp. AM8-1-1]|uniref:hypothetical protein n=1 Tax=Streptomyces sp. AM8-1-1 TaxID=3075825 RepID=UPI0028C3A2F5|nr:hypothetical protein [Streptomyces sp. AM8-1-1]WNO73087.1 hypothetical protein RPQ07_16230 [Streptomyces sp. AM8-1-1]